MRTQHNTVALTFRAPSDFIKTTDDLARFSGVSRSDYIRQAVEEMNARTLAKRMTFLSGRLNAETLAINEALDASLGDGLADR